MPTVLGGTGGASPKPWIAVGAPGARVNGLNAAGVVLLFQEDYASGGQTTPVLRAMLADPDGPAAGARFGAALAVVPEQGGADLDAPPGRLAVGAPEDGPGSEGEGRIIVVRLVPEGQLQISYQSHVRVPEPLSSSERAFGARFVATAADSDNLVDDLAVGMPYHDIGGATDAGAVFVVRGDGGQDYLKPPTILTATAPQSDAHFGWSLADLAANGIPGRDLAVGEPGRDSREGAVHLLSESGTHVELRLDSPAAPFGLPVPTPLPGDEYGWSLDAGQFLSETVPHELLVGAPGREAPGGGANAGMACFIAFGASAFQRCFQQPIDTPEAGDRFGHAVALTGAGAEAPYLHGAAAVGRPGEDSASRADIGAVHLVYFNGSGPSGPIPAVSTALKDPAAQSADYAAFGVALLSHHVAGGTHGDVLVGVPGMPVGGNVPGALFVSKADYESPPGSFSGEYDLSSGSPPSPPVPMEISLVEVGSRVHVSALGGGYVDVLWDTSCGPAIDIALASQGFTLGGVITNVDIEQVGGGIILGGSAGSVPTTVDVTPILQSSVPAAYSSLVPSTFVRLEATSTPPVYSDLEVVLSMVDSAGNDFCMQFVPDTFTGSRTALLPVCE